MIHSPPGELGGACERRFAAADGVYQMAERTMASCWLVSVVVLEVNVASIMATATAVAFDRSAPPKADGGVVVVDGKPSPVEDVGDLGVFGDAVDVPHAVIVIARTTNTRRQSFFTRTSSPTTGAQASRTCSGSGSVRRPPCSGGRASQIGRAH